MKALEKSSTTKGKNLSKKFLFPCNVEKTTEDWLSVNRYLGEKDFNILIGSLKTYKDVVIKFGNPKKIRNEYNFGETAYRLQVSNFMKYLCTFTCNESVSNIQEQDFKTNPFLCHGHGADLGLLVMPYYEKGSLMNYHWTDDNFNVFKNIMKQLVLSLLYAYEQFSFVHGDLHLDNILIRKTKKEQLQYGSHTLETMGLYAVIMDFETSQQLADQPELAYRTIDKLLSLVRDMNKSEIVLECDTSYLTHIITNKVPISDSVYEELLQVVDTIRVRYMRAKSA